MGHVLAAGNCVAGMAPAVAHCGLAQQQRAVGGCLPQRCCSLHRPFAGDGEQLQSLLAPLLRLLQRSPRLAVELAQVRRFQAAASRHDPLRHSAAIGCNRLRCLGIGCCRAPLTTQPSPHCDCSIHVHLRSSCIHVHHVPRFPPQNGLAPRVVELLRRPNATAALSLLQMLRAMYEHHPRPKVGVPRLLELFVGGRRRWQRRAGKRTDVPAPHACSCMCYHSAACRASLPVFLSQTLLSIAAGDLCPACAAAAAQLLCHAPPVPQEFIVKYRVQQALAALAHGQSATNQARGGAANVLSLRHCCPLPCLRRRGCWQGCCRTEGRRRGATQWRSGSCSLDKAGTWLLNLAVPACGDCIPHLAGPGAQAGSKPAGCLPSQRRAVSGSQQRGAAAAAACGSGGGGGAA